MARAVKHFDAEHATENGGDSNRHSNRNESRRPPARQEWREKGENVRARTLARCWTTLWMSAASRRSSAHRLAARPTDSTTDTIPTLGSGDRRRRRGAEAAPRGPPAANAPCRFEGGFRMEGNGALPGRRPAARPGALSEGETGALGRTVRVNESQWLRLPSRSTLKIKGGCC